MSKYPKAKMPDYGDGPEPCEDCAIKDKRIAELEALLDKTNKLAASYIARYMRATSKWSDVKQVLKEISEQPSSNELTQEQYEGADFEDAYDTILGMIIGAYNALSNGGADD